MAESYMNQFLIVDLSARKTKPVPVPAWLKRNYAGGKGFGAKLLLDLLPQKIEAFSPDNLLMFITGPLTATAAPSMRACVVCKSPLTNGYLDSFFGGHLGPEIKFAGYDGIIIHGRAEKPIYLWVCDDRVEFRDASAIRGKDALFANDWIKKDLDEPGAKVATIGPAGENRVRYALISCEYNRQAGRGGAGAVMGSKNLKGLAVKGSRLVRVHDAEKFQSAVTHANHMIFESPECRALTESGTSNAVPWSSGVGTLPVENFKFQDDPEADKIGDIGQSKHLFLGKSACFACPIRCAQMGAVRTGRFAHMITDTVEYESAAMLGSNLKIYDIRAVAHLTRCCDAYGVDSISMGNVIGFAMEAAEKGLIAGPENIALQFGSVEAAEYLIRTVCLQTDDLGRLLGQGVKKAAQDLGNGAKSFALHVRGMELPGWAPRGTPGMGLAYMTADRGACHQRAFMVAFEGGGKLFKGNPVRCHCLENKAQILKATQDNNAGTDTLVKCDFAAAAIDPACLADLFSAATGLPAEGTMFKHLGERIWNLIRCFNLREGLDPSMERLPQRISQNKLSRGPHKGRKISNPDQKTMLADYYHTRGWTKKGVPKAATLERLGIAGEPCLDRKNVLF